jgi:hypothetical protein
MYNSAMLTRLTLCLGIVLLVAGCRAREVEKDLAVTDIHSGWYDVGVVDGQNKLVPSITLRLQNVSSEPIARVQINAVFRRVGEAEEWDAHFVRGIGPDGLAPGAKGDELVLRSDRGYTGQQSRLWVKIGEYTIDRQLLTE